MSVCINTVINAKAHVRKTKRSGANVLYRAENFTNNYYFIYRKSEYNYFIIFLCFKFTPLKYPVPLYRRPKAGKVLPRSRAHRARPALSKLLGER